MEHISVKKKIDRLIITHKIERNEQINTMELDIVNKNEIPALLPVNIRTSLTGKQFRFVVQSFVDLRSFLKSDISYDQFSNVILQIIEALQSCESHGIRCGNLELNSDLAFFDFGNQRVRLIYWPLISLSSYSNIPSFFMELGSIYTAKDKDSAYRVRYLQFFDSRAKFSLDKLKEYVEESRKEWHMAQSGGRKQRVTTNAGEKNISILPTMPLRNYSIRRASTNTVIEITHYPFCIGRKPEYCDYAIEDNGFVSKRHVSILLKNGQAYIRDNGSANGTYLNGTKLFPNQEMELPAGATIRIGNEDFIFLAAGG